MRSRQPAPRRTSPHPGPGRTRRAGRQLRGFVVLAAAAAVAGLAALAPCTHATSTVASGPSMQGPVRVVQDVRPPAAVTSAPQLPRPLAAVKPAPYTSPIRVNGVLLTGYEARLVALVNRDRAARRLPVLVVTPCAEDFARSWTKVIASRNALSHNPKLTLLWDRARCSAATRLAENVGYAGTDPAQVYAAYMRSPGHRANILDSRVRYIGIGAIRRSDGRVFNTMNFTNGTSRTYGIARVIGQGLTGR